MVRAQYFIDQRTQTLYFYPPVPLEAWAEGPFITQHLYATDVSGSSHITLRGLGIHHSRGNGLLAINVTGVRVEDCEISGHGQHGVVMNGTDSGVHGSSVYSVGCSGVQHRLVAVDGLAHLQPAPHRSTPYHRRPPHPSLNHGPRRPTPRQAGESCTADAEAQSGG